jgi:hypothetical protein
LSYGLAFENAPADSLIASQYDPISLPAGGQPYVIRRTERECAASVLDVRPTFQHPVPQYTRKDRLVEIKAGLLKPLRGD